MKKSINCSLALSAVAISLLTACANTRDPQVIKLNNDNDFKLSCSEIETEYNSNTFIATAKIAKNNDDDVQDVAVGLFVWPGLADFKNADGTEGNALLDRNIRLLELAKKNGCETAAYMPQPIRYD